MASRNRPRGAFAKEDASDAHEERNMWSQIVTDIKRLRATHARAAEVAKQQVELEAKMSKCEYEISFLMVSDDIYWSSVVKICWSR